MEKNKYELKKNLELIEKNKNKSQNILKMILEEKIKKIKKN